MSVIYNKLQIPIEELIHAYSKWISGRKVKAIILLMTYFGNDLNDTRKYLENEVENDIDQGTLKIAKIVAAQQETNVPDTAQTVVGFSSREIEEPTGYMGVLYTGSVLGAVYMCITCDDCIFTVRKNNNDEIIADAGHYYRFKKEIEDLKKYNLIRKL
jgi:queuine/archaeosine tRNA-ribosyltransferase